MPIYQILCPDCGHGFSGMVFAGTQAPEKWVCSQCGKDQARLRKDCPPIPHPLESTHGAGCPCCNSVEKSAL